MFELRCCLHSNTLLFFSLVLSWRLLQVWRLTPYSSSAKHWHCSLGCFLWTISSSWLQCDEEKMSWECRYDHPALLFLCSAGILLFPYSSNWLLILHNMCILIPRRGTLHQTFTFLQLPKSLPLLECKCLDINSLIVWMFMGNVVCLSTIQQFLLIDKTDRENWYAGF